MGNRLTQIATRTGDDGSTGLGDNTRVSKNSPRPHAMGDVDELNSQLGLLLCEPLPDGVRTLLGDVDELNSHLGLLLCEPLPADVRALLVEVQHQLFNLGGELSIPGYELLKDDALLQLDEALAEHNAQLPRLQEFILPAGTRAAAQAHICRTVARRAERAVVALGTAEADALLQLDEALAQYNAQLPRLQEFILPAGTRAAAQAHVCRTVARRAERAVVALGAAEAEAMREAPRQYLNRLSDLMFVLARVLNRMDGGDDVYWKSERLARSVAEDAE